MLACRLFVSTALLLLLCAGNIAAPTAESYPAMEAAVNRWQSMMQMAHYKDAAELFESNTQTATRLKDGHMAATFYYGAGTSRQFLLQYHRALADFMQGKEFARRRGDLDSYAMLTAATALVYVDLNQNEAALTAAREAVRVIGPAVSSAHYYPNLLMCSGTAFQNLGRQQEALELFRASTQLAAQQANQPALVRVGWTKIGFLLLDLGRLDDAETALANAFRLRQLAKARDNCPLFTTLGSLRQAQGRYNEALVLHNAAIGCARASTNISPVYLSYYPRAITRIALGQTAEGLADFHLAAQLARVYRAEVPDTDSLQIGTENKLQDLFNEYHKAAAALYWKTGERQHLEALWEAMEENRAVSLRIRARVVQREDSLPDAYGLALRSLRKAELAYLLTSHKPGNLDQLRLQIDEMEMRAGLLGRNRPANQVPDIKEAGRRLGANEALLSFSLGKTESVLLAVTRDFAGAFRLPGADVLGVQIAGFRAAVEWDHSDLAVKASALYQNLFAQLPEKVTRRQLWTILPDGSLFDLPFSALAVSHSAAGVVFLTQVHALRVGFAIPVPSRNAPEGQAFLGYADPIANPADPRWHGKREPESWWRRVTGTNGLPRGISRLPGSGREIQECSKVWGADREVHLLSGITAGRDELAVALALRPAVVHFATHLLQVPDAPQEAALLLGLTADGNPDLLTSGDIARLPAVPRLVALSACQSGRGKSLPGTGLLGLARSWLMAGSDAVVASYWPTPDDTGELFLAFYQTLRSGGVENAAFALQHAQITMLGREGWRSRPKYWAAYFLMGSN